MSQQLSPVCPDFIYCMYMHYARIWLWTSPQDSLNHLNHQDSLYILIDRESLDNDDQDSLCTLNDQDSRYIYDQDSLYSLIDQDSLYIFTVCVIRTAFILYNWPRQPLHIWSGQPFFSNRPRQPLYVYVPSLRRHFILVENIYANQSEAKFIICKGWEKSLSSLFDFNSRLL